MVLLEAYASWESFSVDLVIRTKAGGNFTLQMGEVVDWQSENISPVLAALDAHYGTNVWAFDAQDIHSIRHRIPSRQWTSTLDFVIVVK